jgi:cell division control protein 11
MNADDMVGQSVRLKEDQLRKEEEKVRIYKWKMSRY